MFGSKIKLDKDLIERCRKHAETAGYSSLEEFVAHALEKELSGDPSGSGQKEDEIKDKLKGLGYID